MEEIIQAINNATDVEKKAAAFSALPPDQKSALLEKIQKVQSETTGIFLNAIYSEEKDKEIRKVIRKLLFKLKSAGVKVEEPRTIGETVLKRIKEVREHRGFLTNYDYMQTRLVVAGFEIKKNTYLFLNAEIHFSNGLMELMSVPVDKKGFEGILKGYQKDTKPHLFFEEISPAYAAYLIEEGSHRSGKFRDEIKPLRSFASGVAEGLHEPKDIYALRASNTEDGVPPEAIFAHEIFQPFFMTWDSLEEDRKTYMSNGGSTIILPPHMAEQKRIEFLERLAERADMKAVLPYIKRMMEDYAYLFYCMKEFGYYKGLTAWLDNERAPWQALSYFLNKSLGKEEESPEEKLTAGGLIVDPYG